MATRTERRCVDSPAKDGGSNVLYPMKRALAARTTVGEVCHALRDVWGTYVPSETF